jgi:hypothetical protein
MLPKKLNSSLVCKLKGGDIRYLARVWITSKVATNVTRVIVQVKRAIIVF